MKVSFRQSGGFTGLARGCDLDTERMSPEEAATLESLVEQSHLAESVAEHAPQARDAYQYLITVEDEGKGRQASVDDRTLPDSARPLLRFLQQRAHPLSRR